MTLEGRWHHQGFVKATGNIKPAANVLFHILEPRLQAHDFIISAQE
jgi:hypothetical protein